MGYEVIVLVIISNSNKGAPFDGKSVAVDVRRSDVAFCDSYGNVCYSCFVRKG